MRVPGLFLIDEDKVWGVFIFANKGHSAERGEFGCGEIYRHFLAGHGLKFRQCMKSLEISSNNINFAHDVKEKCFLFLAL